MCNLKTMLYSACLLLITLPLPSNAHDKRDHERKQHDKFNIAQLVQWKGVGLPVLLPKGVGGNIVAEDTPCYKVPMVMPQSGIEIGSGYDCISNPGSLTTLNEGTVTTYYIFVFHGRGSIISKNRVVVRNAADDDPLNAPPDSVPVNQSVTHILGSFPDDDTILAGTRKYRNAAGKVRVSGAVSLANFPDEIVFDDLFVIHFE